MPWYNVLPNNLFQGTPENFFLHPMESGFLYFTMGGLVLLSIYHLFLYFQNKNGSYGIYALYLLFLILSQNEHVMFGFLAPVFEWMGRFREYGELYTEISYILYFFFVFKFLNIKEDFSRWHRYLKRAIVVIAVYSLIHFIIYFVTSDFLLNLRFYHFFVIYTLILSALLYILMFRSKRRLKYYVIFGSLLLLIFSVASLVVFGILLSKDAATEPAFSLLYLGYIAENFLFSLGLGRQQRVILDERNAAQKELIHQMRQNEELELNFRKNLEKEVEQLRLKVEKDAVERLSVQFEKDLAELKLASLRSQMNPHFIFNSLNSIKGFIIDNDKSQAVFYLNKFSKLIRMILSSSMESDISLAEEIEIAELYLRVENIRFNNEIELDIEIDPKLALNSIKVPALILQPFLENAIWHGLSSKKGERILRVQINKKDDFLEFIVRDNGIGREESAKIKKKKLLQRESYGMRLTEDRLKSFGGSESGNYSIAIEDLKNADGSPKGTQITVRLPIILN